MAQKRKAIPKGVRYLVHEKYEGHCAYCGCEIKYSEMQIDHIKDIYNNGEDNSLENLNPACRMCNFYKHTKSIDKFRRELGLILTRLKKDFTYRLALKYGLITEHPDKKIEFFYEKYEK